MNQLERMARRMASYKPSKPRGGWRYSTPYRAPTENYQLPPRSHFVDDASLVEVSVPLLSGWKDNSVQPGPYRATILQAISEAMARDDIIDELCSVHGLSIHNALISLEAEGMFIA